MELVRLAAAILTITFIGWNLLYLVSFGKLRKLYFLERLFISYGMGLGFLSLEMLAFHFLNSRFSLFKILTPWIALLATNLIVYYRNKVKGSSAPLRAERVSGNFLKSFLIIGIIFEIVYAFFRSLIKPLEAYDAIAIYAIRAKIFYVAGSIPADFFKNLSLSLPHPDYPLNIPLSETLVYLFLGSLNDQLVKAIFPLFFIGILAMIYFGIRRFASQTYALLFTFILATVPQFNAYATNGYLDLPLAFYCASSALFLFLWFKDTDEIRYLLISGVMAALACWTKNEGLMYCFINTMLIIFFSTFERRRATVKKRIYSLCLYILIIAVIYSPWLYVKAASHLVNDEIDLIDLNPFNVVQQLYKIAPILYEFQKQIFGPKKWNVLWFVVILTLIFKYRYVFRGIQKYISIALSLAVGGYVLTYLVSRLEIGYALRTTWSRFIIHFLPVLVFWLAAILKEDIDR